MDTPMWTLKSGELTRDRKTSHLHGNVLDLLSEALPQINAADRDFIIVEFDFGRTIGDTTCVPTNEQDEIVFAQRPNRAGHTRFVKNRLPESSSTLVVILKRFAREVPEDPEQFYVIITAFIGRKAEPEPWDPRATPESASFWSTNALLWGAEEVLPETETTTCPW